MQVSFSVLMIREMAGTTSGEALPASRGGECQNRSGARRESLEEQGRCMSTQRSAGDRSIDRDRLLKRMFDARDSGDGKRVEGALAEAKRWLSDNRVGDNAVRDAQFRLLRAFPPR